MRGSGGAVASSAFLPEEGWVIRFMSGILLRLRDPKGSLQAHSIMI